MIARATGKAYRSLTATDYAATRRTILGCRSRRLRSMRQFAEDELVIPSGPYEGLRFNVDRQPYTRLWLDAVDSGQWTTYAATGPSQSGKSLTCFVLPVMYHLCEWAEAVVIGLYDGDMAWDKWERDLRPAIERSRYRWILPTAGRGSKGGKFDTLHLRNGAILKIMTGGGGDKSRAHFTARVACFTEVDALGASSSTSVEASKVLQIEARTLSYGSARRIYKECTVSVEDGHIWTEYTKGTRSSINLHCPHCRAYVVPEREHLIGWQTADNEIAANTGAAVQCPECRAQWSEEERKQANLSAVLCHRGQKVDAHGHVIGDRPPVETLGFRWNAANNMFLSSGFVGASEWRASKAVSEDDAERQMCQFYWAVPYSNPNFEASRLDFDRTRRKWATWSKGLIPDNTKYITVGIDCGKRLLHWVAVAWLDGDAGGHIFDYGREEVPSDDMAVEQALTLALRAMRDRCEHGWLTTEGKERPPDQVWIDAGWLTGTIKSFVLESDTNFYRPIIGRGAAQDKKRLYNDPKRTGARVKHLGDGFHIAYMPADQIYMVEINADLWKSRTHQMLRMSKAKKGTMTLFRGTANEHVSFVKHMMSEHEVDEFVPGRGVVKRWDKLHSNNHWFDSLYISSAAASFCGFSLFDAGDEQTGASDGKLTITQLQRN